MKICIIGDLHIGQNKNNPLFHTITLKYSEWVLDQIKDRNVDQIWQMGDLFHDRVSVNLVSMNCASQFMDTLSNHYPIKMIVGNHDSFYLENSDVHSLSLLKKWPNIEVYDTPTKCENVFFCPWGTTPDQIEKSDIVVGHFEINAYDMGSGKVCSKGITATELLKKTNKLVISGHFHKPQGRKYEGNKIILYTGSAFQLSWKETEEDKYIYILDTDTCKIEKIKNNISPKFEYIYSEEDLHKIKNNIVSIVADSEEKLNNLLHQSSVLSPLNIKTQLIDTLIIGNTTKDIENFKINDIDSLIDEFVNTIQGIEEHYKIDAIAILKQLYKEVN